MPCALAHGARAKPSPRTELADIVRRCGDDLRRARVLAGVQLRALRAIENCRTPVLGGHRETCDRCGTSRSVYHSCRNRHCPKCQTLAKERWIEARRAELLPVPYFHLVFTLPHELNRLAQHQPRVIYNLLFDAAASTLATFGRDPKHRGGEIGITAILHTWGQNLGQHIHLHCLVTGGALASGGSKWSRANPRYLFPVRALSPVFRAKFLVGLERAFDKQLLPGEFLRRFLLHVLPRGFMRIRHFGLLANRHRKAKLERCRELLHAPTPKDKPAETVAEMVARLTGKDLTVCPFCEQGTMRITEQLAPSRSLIVPILDSS